ncbi:MAG: hypothetical protein U0230_11375 [Polyangiales bacterium]
MRGLGFGIALVLSACAGPAKPYLAKSTAPTNFPAHPPLHPVLEAYIGTLETFLEPGERARLEAVDLGGTLPGDAQRLRYLAADRVVHALLPRALEVAGDPRLSAHAERLRALPPLLNRDTDLVAAPAVRAAVRALRAHREGMRRIEAPTSPRLEDLLADDSLAEASAGLLDVDAEAEAAEAMALYAETYARVHGLSALEGDAAAAAASDAVDAALVVEQMGRAYGIPRDELVTEALDLASDMAEAARRRERIPVIRTPREVPPDPGLPRRLP